MWMANRNSSPPRSIGDCSAMKATPTPVAYTTGRVFTLRNQGPTSSSGRNTRRRCNST
jgi:hypothetical protein